MEDKDSTVIRMPGTGFRGLVVIGEGVFRIGEQDIVQGGTVAHADNEVREKRAATWQEHADRPWFVRQIAVPPEDGPAVVLIHPADKIRFPAVQS